MLKRTLIAAATLAGVLGAGVALAQPHGGGWHHDSLLEGVTLTDSQQTQMHALHKASWQANKPLMQQMHAVQQQIDSVLLGSGSVTEANLAPLVAQKEALEQKLDAARMSEMISVRNLLTSDQIAQAASSHAKMESLHAQEMALHQQAPATAE